MDKLIAVLIGLLCGVVQFFILRYTLKALSKGEEQGIGKTMLLRLPLPIALLVVCAVIDVSLLPFIGAAFCLSLIAASVINHVVTLKKKG